MGNSESQPTQPEPVLKFQRTCGYWFEQNELLNQILTLEGDDRQLLERLELLGDKVLTLISLDYFEKKFPKTDTTELKQKQAEMISEEKLVSIATTLVLVNLHKLLATGTPQVSTMSWSSRVKILIGGIYKDAGGGAAGTKTADICISKLWGLHAAAASAVDDQEYNDYIAKGLDHATDQLFDD